MKTRFYNALRKEYDPETHNAIENWIDTGFSADEYARVYFRIDCPTFDCVSASFILVTGIFVQRSITSAIS